MIARESSTFRNGAEDASAARHKHARAQFVSAFRRPPTDCSVEKTGLEDKMTGKIDARLTELGVTLPEAPAPAANYVPFVRTGRTG